MNFKFYAKDILWLLVFSILIFFARINLFADLMVEWPEFHYCGNMALDLASGNVAALGYRTIGHMQTVLLPGFFASFFAFVFGNKFIILYLSYFILTIITLFLLYIFVRKYWGYETALLSALFYAVMPYTILQETMFGIGGHGNVDIFVLLNFMILFSVLYGSNKRNNSINFFLLGVVSGFGIYICPTVIISFTVSLAFLLFSRKGNVKYYLILLLGLIIGNFPFILFNLRNYFAGLSIGVNKAILNAKVKYEIGVIKYIIIKLLLFMEIARRYLTVRLPHIYNKLKCLTEVVLLYFFGIVFIHGLIINGIDFFRKKVIKKEFVLCIYIAAVLLAYMAYPYLVVDTLYILHLYTLFIIIVSAVLVGLLSRKGKYLSYRPLAILLTILIIIWSLSGYLKMAKSHKNRMNAYEMFKHKADTSLVFFYGNERKKDIDYLLLYDRWKASTCSHNEILLNGVKIYKYRGVAGHVLCREEKLQEGVSGNKYLYIALGMIIGDSLYEDKLPYFRNEIKRLFGEEERIFIYEGMAISLMRVKRSYIENKIYPDIVKKYIPVKYRFYFDYLYTVKLIEDKGVDFYGGLSELQNYVEKVNREYLYGLYLLKRRVVNKGDISELSYKSKTVFLFHWIYSGRRKAELPEELLSGSYANIINYARVLMEWRCYVNDIELKYSDFSKVLWPKLRKKYENDLRKLHREYGFFLAVEKMGYLNEYEREIFNKENKYYEDFMEGYEFGLYLRGLSLWSIDKRGSTRIELPSGRLESSPRM